MKNTCPFYNGFEVLNIHLIKISKTEPPDLLFFVVFVGFYISRYIIFHKFSELYSILSVKKIFVTKGFTQPSPLSPSHCPFTPHLTAKIRSAWRKFFVDAPLDIFVSDTSIARNLHLPGERTF